MAIVEYPEGAAFPGVIGRTTDESSPAWPAPTRAPEGCPQRAVRRPRRHGLRPAGLLRQPDRRRRTSTRSPPTGCASTTCTPRRCARRAAPASSPGATTTATAWPASPSSRPATPATTASSPSRTASSPRCCSSAATTRSWSASGTSLRATRRPPRGRTTAGRWHAASSASTASWAATPASGIPTSCTTTTRSNRRRRPKRAITSPRTSSTSRSSSSPTPNRSTPTSPSTCTSASGPRTRRTTSPRSGPTSTPASSTTAGTPTARRCFARQKELGIVPADAELSRHDPDVPEWNSLPEPARRLSSRMMEVFAGFLSHTDHHLGRLLDYLRDQGELDNTIVMVISDNGASAEGGPTGTTNEAQFFNNAQEPLEESLKVIDEIGGPKHFNHYPWGWTWAGNTPFRRWKRETYRGGACDPFIVSWPGGHQGQRRGAHAVRPHHRHGADRARSAGCRAARRDQGRHAVAPPGRQLRAYPRRPRRRQQAPHAVLRDARPPRHLPRRLARRLPLARSVVHRGRRRLRAADLGGEALRARRQGLGALPRRRGLRREPQRGGREPRQAHRAHRDLVRRGRQVRGHARRRQRPGSHDRRETPRGRASRELHVHARHAVGPVLRRAARR